MDVGSARWLQLTKTRTENSIALDRARVGGCNGGITLATVRQVIHVDDDERLRSIAIGVSLREGKPEERRMFSDRHLGADAVVQLDPKVSWSSFHGAIDISDLAILLGILATVDIVASTARIWEKWKVSQ
jgi:hypothetical protein